MKYAIAHVEGVAGLVQSRFHETPKLNKEAHRAYEDRTWKNKAHVDKNGVVFIPGMAFKNCVAEIAKYLSMQIPEKGKQTYTKHFESGVAVIDNVSLGVKIDDVEPLAMFVPSNGRRGGGTRVTRIYPSIPAGWQGVVEFVIYDDVITKDVFLHHLKQAGQLVGIGTFRVRNNGMYGRFKVKSLDWQEVTEENVDSVLGAA